MLVWPGGLTCGGGCVAGSVALFLVWPRWWSWSHGFPGHSVPIIVVSISVLIRVFVRPGW